MYRIQTIVKASTIHGVGVFADQDIKKGQLTWEYDEHLDHAFTVDSITKHWLPLGGKVDYLLREIYNYGWESSKHPGVIIYNFDGSRYTNHSTKPCFVRAPKTTDTWEYSYVAARDLKQGEELTQNYLEFGASSSCAQLWESIERLLEIQMSPFFTELFSGEEYGK